VRGDLWGKGDYQLLSEGEGQAGGADGTVSFYRLGKKNKRDGENYRTEPEELRMNLSRKGTTQRGETKGEKASITFKEENKKDKRLRKVADKSNEKKEPL